MGSIIGHRIDCNGGMGSERPAAHAPPGGGWGTKICRKKYRPRLDNIF